RPSAFAVFRLMTNSYLVGAWLLCARCARPGHCRATEQGNELAPLQLISHWQCLSTGGGRIQKRLGPVRAHPATKFRVGIQRSRGLLKERVARFFPPDCAGRPMAADDDDIVAKGKELVAD